MNRKIFMLLLIVAVALLLARPALADGDPPYNPLQQPPPQSQNGMDLMGPGWQWTFPREAAKPRLDGAIREDLMDEMFQKSWAAGVRGARIATLWCLVEPERDQYDWAPLDIAYQLASNYGMIVVPEIFYTPDWAALGSDVTENCMSNKYPRNLPPQNMDDWSDFMADMVQRYGVFGKNQVHNWEIWNEPDLWEFWFVRPDPEVDGVPAYARLLKRARKEIDQHDIGGNLLLGGMSDIHGHKFIKELMALEGDLNIADDIDIVALHTFSDHVTKIRVVKEALGAHQYELWATELNNAVDWTEETPPEKLEKLHQDIANEGVTRNFWFKGITSKWGPGIFKNTGNIWETEHFKPSPFYETFRQQAFPHDLPAAPMLQWPPPRLLHSARPTFIWKRPAPGDFAIAGYKLQVDDSLYHGHPYFTSPELDVWVPAGSLIFTPLQMTQGRSGPGLQANTPGDPPTLPQMRYQPVLPLPPGRYTWRVAAVDVQGNVGPYSIALPLHIEAGPQRIFLPALSY